MATATETAFTATIVTPEAQVFDAQIASAQLPAHDGLIGILAHHAPLLTKLGAGVLKLDTTAGEKKFFVSSGFAQVVDNRLSVITDEAIPLADISKEKATAEYTKAEALPATDDISKTRRSQALARAAAMKFAVGA